MDSTSDPLAGSNAIIVVIIGVNIIITTIIPIPINMNGNRIMPPTITTGNKIITPTINKINSIMSLFYHTYRHMSTPRFSPLLALTPHYLYTLIHFALLSYVSTHAIIQT